MYLIHEHTTQVKDMSSTVPEKHTHLGGVIKAGSQGSQSVHDSQSEHIKAISERKGELEKVTSTQVVSSAKDSTMNLIDQKETILSSDKTDSNVNGYHGNTAEIDSSSRHQGDQIISDLEVLTATAYICLLCGLSGTE